MLRRPASSSSPYRSALVGCEILDARWNTASTSKSSHLLPPEAFSSPVASPFSEKRQDGEEWGGDAAARGFPVDGLAENPSAASR